MPLPLGPVLPPGIQPHRERGVRRDEVLGGGRQAARVSGGPHPGEYILEMQAAPVTLSFTTESFLLLFVPMLRFSTKRGWVGV